MNDLISRQAAIDHLKKRLYETAMNNNTEHPYYEEMADNRVDVWMNELPTIDAVPVGAYEQTRWERDMAISQLAEIGKSLCEKMDNVATVVRCKDCKYWGMHKSLNVPWCFEMHIDKSEDGYCDCGERREDG